MQARSHYSIHLYVILFLPSKLDLLEEWGSDDVPQKLCDPLLWQALMSSRKQHRWENNTREMSIQESVSKSLKICTYLLFHYVSKQALLSLFLTFFRHFFEHDSPTCYMQNDIIRKLDTNGQEKTFPICSLLVPFSSCIISPVSAPPGRKKGSMVYTCS